MKILKYPVILLLEAARMTTQQIKAFGWQDPQHFFEVLHIEGGNNICRISSDIFLNAATEQHRIIEMEINRQFGIRSEILFDGLKQGLFIRRIVVEQQKNIQRQ